MASTKRTDEDWRAMRSHAAQLFTPSSPMTVAELFAGRSSQIQILADVVAERGRHAILYGEPGVGKTSTANILRHFVKRTRESILCVRHAVVSSDTYSSVWLEILRQLTNTSSSKTLFESNPVSDLYGTSITQTDVVRSLSYLGEAIIPIIIIDEYQQFRDPTAALYFAETIKGVSDANLNATLIVVGVGDSVAELVGGHSSITRCCEEVLMPRMHSDEIQDLLYVRVAQLGMTMVGDAKWKIVGLAKGLPAFAHALGKSAVFAAIARRSLIVTEADVDKGIASTVASSKQTLKTCYEDATNSNQEHAKFKQLITACAMTKPDASGWFTPKDVEVPFANILGRHRRIDHFNANLKDFASEKRGKILQMKGGERSHRFRFTDSSMQPYVLMKGIEAGLIDKKAMSILSSPEQNDLFSDHS